MKPRHIIEPPAITAMKYAVHFYQQSRPKKTLPGKFYDTIAISCSYVKESVQTTFSGTSSNKDTRTRLCDDYLALIDNLTSENIVSTLTRMGDEAEAIQAKELKRYEVNQKISDFTQCAHFLRHFMLYKILRPLSKLKELKEPSESASLEEKERYIFIKTILQERDVLKKKLSDKLQELRIAQDSGHTLSDIAILEKKAHEFRYHLAYLGDITSLECVTLRKVLFNPKFYSIDPLDPKCPPPAFPYVLQTHFVVTYIKRIYKKQDLLAQQNAIKSDLLSQLSGKNDDEVINHFEEYASEQMQLIYLKQNELKKAEQKKIEATKELDIAKAKFPEQQPSTIGSFFSLFIPSMTLTPTTELPLSIQPPPRDFPILERRSSDSSMSGERTPIQQPTAFFEQKNEDSEVKLDNAKKKKQDKDSESNNEQSLSSVSLTHQIINKVANV